MFWVSFHSEITSRVFDYAPPDTVQQIYEQFRLNIYSK